jgi:hypothetical protein
MMAKADAVDGWIPRRRAMALLGLKSKSTFYKLAARLASQRIGMNTVYEHASIIALAKERDGEGTHPASRVAPAPELAPAASADAEQWVSATEAKAYTNSLDYQTRKGRIRRRDTGSPSTTMRYVYALSDLKALAAEHRPRKRRRDAGKKADAREAEIANVNAQLDRAAVTEGDTRADIIAFGKRRCADTPHFHAIHITVAADGRFIVEIEQKKTDRFEMERGG